MARNSSAPVEKPCGVRPRTVARSKRKPSKPAAAQWRSASRTWSQHRRPLGRQGVAAARPVDEAAVFVVAIVKPAVETAKRQRRALDVAFGGVIEDDVEDDADARLAEGGDGIPHLDHATRGHARIGRHEGHRVVTPHVGKAEGGEMAFVAPSGNRHDLDGVDAEAAQMGDRFRMGEAGERPTLRFRNRLEPAGERARRNLVDHMRQPRLDRDAGQRGPDDRLGHEGRGVDGGLARRRELGAKNEGAVELHRIGIDQELRWIEPAAAGGIVGSVGPQPVAGARLDCADEGVTAVAGAPRQSQARHLAPALGVEEAEENLGGVLREHAHIDPAAGDGDAERRRLARPGYGSGGRHEIR